LSEVYINDTNYFTAASTGKYNAAQPNVFIKREPVVKTNLNRFYILFIEKKSGANNAPDLMRSIPG